MTHPRYAPVATSKVLPDRGAAHSIGSWSLGHSRDASMAMRTLVAKRQLSVKPKNVCTDASHDDHGRQARTVTNK